MLPPLDIPLLRTFVALVEDQSLTRVAERQGRTQPAISLQLKRLEEAATRSLFEPNRRRLTLTPAGALLLGYARSILQQHDEVQARLSARPPAGRVVLGCPDLYAAFLLPAIIAGFRRSHPDVEVVVRCALTRTLVEELSAQVLDLALTTDMPQVAPRVGRGTRLRREQLVWLGNRDGAAHHETPLPLAMLPEGNLFRDYAIEALERAGRAWRIATISESVSGLHTMVLAGAAVTVLARSSVPVGLRELGHREGLPPLPFVNLMLWERSPGDQPAVDDLAAHILDSIR